MTIKILDKRVTSSRQGKIEPFIGSAREFINSYNWQISLRTDGSFGWDQLDSSKGILCYQCWSLLHTFGLAQCGVGWEDSSGLMWILIFHNVRIEIKRKVCPFLFLKILPWRDMKCSLKKNKPGILIFCYGLLILVANKQVIF